MELKDLCAGIGLPTEVAEQVYAFCNAFDFSQADHLLHGFRDFRTMERSRLELQELLGEDENHVKMLSCMLREAVRAHDWYRRRGISDRIYFDTMACFSRFLEETRQITGRYDFDRYFWTPRQVGCHLFRVGALEYEVVEKDPEAYIALHIPSDADFSPDSVDTSLTEAEAFFAGQFPELEGSEYRCHSWLLEPELRRMLKENSNIRSFQDRFALTGEGEPGLDFVQWLFRMDASDLSSLPEDTSLRRNVKRHVLSGGVIRNMRGIMKHRSN